MEEGVLEMYKSIYGSDTDHPYIATSMSNLALSYGELGQHMDALAMKKNVLEMRKRIYGADADHPEIAGDMNNLAITYYDLRLFDEGASCIEKSLAMYKVLGHPEAVATQRFLERRNIFWKIA